MNVTANNWLLPLDGEHHPEAETIRQKSVEIFISWTDPKTFTDMQNHWWWKHFRTMKYADLKRSITGLGMTCPRSRDAAATMLTQYFFAICDGREPYSG